MLHSLSTGLRCGLSGAALTAMASGLAIVPAQAGDGHLKTLSFKTTSAYNQVVRVVSSDRKTWNKIEPGTARFFGEIDIVAKPLTATRIVRTGVVLGACGSSCNSTPLIWQSGVNLGKSYQHSQYFTFDPSRLPVSKNGHIATLPYGDDILRRCNEKLAANGPTKAHAFDYTLHATLVVDSEHAIAQANSQGGGPAGVPQYWSNETDHQTAKAFQVRVVCQPVPASPTNDLAAAKPSFKVNGIALRFLTTAGYPSKPNPGTQCQVTNARVRVATSTAGPVKFRLWTKIGGGAATSQFVEAWSKHVGNGKFEAVFNKTLKVGHSAPVQAMAEDLTNPIGQSTGWKLVKLGCTGAGGGGLAGSTPQGDLPKPPKPPKRLINGAKDLTAKPTPTHATRPVTPVVVKTAPRHREGRLQAHINRRADD